MNKFLCILLLAIVSASALSIRDHLAIQQNYVNFWMSIEHGISEVATEGTFNKLHDTYERYFTEDIAFVSGNSHRGFKQYDTVTYVLDSIFADVKGEHHSSGFISICRQGPRTALLVINDHVIADSVNEVFSDGNRTTVVIEERKYFYFRKVRGDWKIFGIYTDGGIHYTITGDWEDTREHRELTPFALYEPDSCTVADVDECFEDWDNCPLLSSEKRDVVEDLPVMFL